VTSRLRFFSGTGPGWSVRAGLFELGSFESVSFGPGPLGCAPKNLENGMEW
jgi:hypothetical protein